MAKNLRNGNIQSWLRKQVVKFLHFAKTTPSQESCTTNKITIEQESVPLYIDNLVPDPFLDKLCISAPQISTKDICALNQKFHQWQQEIFVEEDHL